MGHSASDGEREGRDLFPEAAELSENQPVSRSVLNRSEGQSMAGLHTDEADLGQPTVRLPLPDLHTA